MSFITIILFFLYTWGFGYTVTKFLKNSDNLLERNLMRIGIGLGTFLVVGVILARFRLPMDWRIFFFLSLVLPIVNLIKYIIKGKVPEIKLKLTKSNLNILAVLLIFSITLYMYSSGAFKYPWLEDDDPWTHALDVKYVTIEKSIFEPTKDATFLHYIDPYPPGYDLLMGVLHQTSPSINWTLKFFNALIISLGIIFFYFFIRRFTDNRNKALFSTFVLAAIPCYLSHFIWAHSLVATLLIISLYCLVMIDFDKKWILPSILLICSTWLTQPTQPIKFFFIYMIYFIIKSLYSGRFAIKEFSAIIGGYLLSFIWWATKFRAMFTLATLNPGASSSATVSSNMVVRLWNLLKKAFPYDGGTATRVYTFSDFFIAKSQNMINNPIGIGIMISLLVLISLVIIIISYKSMSKEKKIWISTTILWFVFTFLGANSMTFKLPFGLFAFRFWMLLAIPVAILASEGLWFLYSFGKNFHIPKTFILFLIVVGIIFTSGSQKFALNTAVWGPGVGFSSYEDVIDFSYISSLPQNTPIHGFCAWNSIQKIIGFDQFECGWCADVIEVQKKGMNKSVDTLYSWMKRKKYEYTIIDAECARLYGINETNNKIQEMLSSGKFQPVNQGSGVILLRLL